MQNFKKNIARRNVLPSRIIITCTLTALIGIISIIILLFQITNISNQYKTMIANDYTNIQYMNEISNNLYLHQSLMYKYTSTDDISKLESLKKEADALKEELNQILISFGYSLKGTEYEKYYHNIYSSSTGYFYDINQVFSFYEAGDINTAKYYIDHAMEECITSVNKSIAELNSITQADMEKSQSLLYIRLHYSRIFAFIGIIIIIAFAIYSIINSARTADEMISVDSLTDVYNYDKLLRYATKMEHKGRLQEYTVISLNIKDFKYINQLNGSNAGDEILKKLAIYIIPFIGKQEIISRSGGDNFILLVKSPNTDKIVSNLNDIKINLTNSKSNKNINLKTRCGIYDITFGDDIYTALNNASIALNKSRLSTSSIVFFSEKMIDEMIEEKEILSAFPEALKNKEFKVYYQPKVDMTTGVLYGAEALVRWYRNGQIVAPFKFIPILEKDGSITELDMYVFNQVCSDLEKWKKDGINTVKISSNFSKLHLQNSHFAEDVLNVLNRYDISHSMVEVELTESSGYEDLTTIQNFINKMRQNNVCTSIDDFGTGYSSLSMLQELDVDTIKLDKSFVDHIGDQEASDEKTRKMVKNVIHLVNDLQKEVVCEGVETDIQAIFLVNAGCKIAQGYLYNKPITKEEFEERLKSPDYSLSFKSKN